MAYEWKCLPDEIERQSPRQLATMFRYLRWRDLQQQKARKG